MIKQNLLKKNKNEPQIKSKKQLIAHIDPRIERIVNRIGRNEQWDTEEWLAAYGLVAAFQSGGTKDNQNCLI